MPHVPLSRLLLAVGAAAALAGCGTVHNTIRDGADEHVILRGNDAVAYFTQGKPVKGDPGIRATYDGDTYRFASEANKRLFEQDPRKYAPAYAGFCASGAITTRHAANCTSGAPRRSAVGQKTRW